MVVSTGDSTQNTYLLGDIQSIHMVALTCKIVDVEIPRLGTKLGFARRHARCLPPLWCKIRRRRPPQGCCYPSHFEHRNSQCRGIRRKNLNLNSIRIRILPSDPSTFHSIMLDGAGDYDTTFLSWRRTSCTTSARNCSPVGCQPRYATT